MHYFSGKGCSESLESMHYCIGILITYHLPILCLQDIGDITMNLQAVSEGRDDYLCYPAPDTDRFNLPFNEWLERYIVCQGHEFWFFLNP